MKMKVGTVWTCSHVLRLVKPGCMHLNIPLITNKAKQVELVFSRLT